MLFVIIQLSMSRKVSRKTLKVGTNLKQMFNNSNQQVVYEQDEKPFKDSYQRSHLLMGRNNKNSASQLVPIEVPIQNLLDLIEIYEWRGNTDYPVVNSNWKRVIFNKSISFIADKVSRAQLAAEMACHHPLDMAILWVSTEPIVPLQHFQLLSIGQFLYAFKEALVGFERLFALFGTFQINARMIGVNNEGKIRVWVSHHYHINAKIDIDMNKMFGNEQEYLVFQIKDIFLRVASEGTTFREFFKGIYYAKTFIECLKYIEDFTSAKKIITTRKIILKQKFSQKRPLSPIINLKPIARTPKFIAMMQHKNQLQQSIPSLSFRKSAEIPKQFHFSQLKTKQTVNQTDCFEQSSQFSSNAGKIVKNRGRHCLLSQARSLKSLHQISSQSVGDQFEGYTVQQHLRKLLDDEPEYEIEGDEQGLMKLGRQVRQSFIII